MKLFRSIGRDAGMMHPRMKTDQKNLRGDCDGRISPGRAGENHFGRKQRTKFVSRSAVLRCTAEQFVGAVEVPDEAGVPNPAMVVGGKLRAWIGIR